MTHSVVGREQLVADLRSVGLRDGDLVNVKASLKSIGRVDGGAATLIDALLDVVGTTGTLVSDSFVRSYLAPRMWVSRNEPTSRTTPSYAGALANAMIRHPGAERSAHPIQKFTAIGALARELMSNHLPDRNAYHVLYEMTRRGGKNLRIGPSDKVPGVGTTHVAINHLRLRQQRWRAGRWYRTEAGDVRLAHIDWPGGCPVGFRNFESLYASKGAVLARGRIGDAPAMVSNMRATLQLELAVLGEDPRFMLCDNPNCTNCQVTWPFSPSSIPRFAWSQLRKGHMRKAASVTALSVLGRTCPPRSATSRLPEPSVAPTTGKQPPQDGST